MLYKTFFNVLSSMLLVCIKIEVASQRNRSFPFVTIPDSSVAFGRYQYQASHFLIYKNTDDFSIKVYNTTFLIENLSEEKVISDEKLLQELNNFYNKSVKLEGFIRIIPPILLMRTNNITTSVTYQLEYNYSTLLANVASDKSIFDTIGSLSPIRDKLINNDFFENFTILNTGFTFKGDSLCEKVGCQKGEYVMCSEVKQGVITTCASICKRNFCLNNGWCHHYNQEEQAYCSCPSTSTDWYVGRRCELYIQIWMFIIALVIFCILFIIIIVTTYYFIEKLKKSKDIKYIKQTKTPSNQVLGLTVEDAPTTKSYQNIFILQQSNQSLDSPTFESRSRNLPIERINSISHHSSNVSLSENIALSPPATTVSLSTTNQDTADLSSLSNNSYRTFSLLEDRDVLNQRFKEIANSRSNKNISVDFPRSRY